MKGEKDEKHDNKQMTNTSKMQKLEKNSILVFMSDVVIIHYLK